MNYYPKRRLEMKFHLLISDLAKIDVFCVVFFFLLSKNISLFYTKPFAKYEKTAVMILFFIKTTCYVK